MTRTTRTIAAAAALTLGAFTAVPALATNTATASASVDILQALNVTATTPMNFGQILAPETGNQDFVMDTAGVVDDSAGSGMQTGASTAAVFSVTGEASTTLDVTTNIDANFNGSGVTLSALTPSTTALTLDGTGAGAVDVGATLNVASTADPATAYSATISLTVNYQ